jgi:hypothetical protein
MLQRQLLGVAGINVQTLYRDGSERSGQQQEDAEDPAARTKYEVF